MAVVSLLGAAAVPDLLLAAPLCAPVREPDLDPGLGHGDQAGESLPQVDVGVVGLLKLWNEW